MSDDPLDDGGPTLTGTAAVHALARDGLHRFAEIASEHYHGDDE